MVHPSIQGSTCSIEFVADENPSVCIHIITTLSERTKQKEQSTLARSWHIYICLFVHCLPEYGQCHLCMAQFLCIDCLLVLCCSDLCWAFCTVMLCVKSRLPQHHSSNSAFLQNPKSKSTYFKRKVAEFGYLCSAGLAGRLRAISWFRVNQCGLGLLPYTN